MENRCPTCHAPLPASPASAGRRCPRCGAPLPFAGETPAGGMMTGRDAPDEVTAWARRLAVVVLDDIRVYRPELLASLRPGELPAGPLAEELARTWSWWRERVGGSIARPERLFREVASHRLGVVWPVATRD